MKGFLEITKYKAEKINGQWEPIEQIDFIKKPNAIFYYSIHNMFFGSSGAINYPTSDESRIALSEYDGILNETAGPRYEKINPTYGFIPQTSNGAEANFIGDDIEIIFTSRFNPPGSGTRNINSVFIMEGTSTSSLTKALAGVSLNSTVEQNDEEILEVKYKFYLDDLNLGEDLKKNDFIRFLHARVLGHAGVDYGLNQFPFFGLWFSNQDLDVEKIPQRNGMITMGDNIWLERTSADDSSGPGPTPNSTQLFAPNNRGFISSSSMAQMDFEQRQRKITCQAITAESNIGRIWSKGLIWSCESFNLDGNPFTNVNINLHRLLCSHDYIPNDETRVQSIFLHAENAPRPYLDIDNLGSGTGEIELQESTYPDEMFPEFYKINITTNGDTGVAEYNFQKRYQFGFGSNEYYREGVLPILSLTRYDRMGDMANEMHHIQDGDTPQNIYFYTKFYDDETFIVGDYTGLTFVNLKNFNRFNIDANSTPSLTTTKINNYAITSTGEVLIATSDNGLYSLSNDQNTVTLITPSPETDVDFTKCYYVAVKDNDDIWAAFDGALAKSTDNGSTWTIYNPDTTPSFEYTGITDGSWDNIVGLILDKSNDRMAIYSKLNNLIWWAPNDSAIEFYTHGSLSYSQDLPMLNEKQCYHIPGTDFWVFKQVQSIATIEYGEITTTASRNPFNTTSGALSLHNYRFFIEQDSNGDWGILMPDRYSNGTVWNLWDVNLNKISQWTIDVPHNIRKTIVLDYYGKGLGLIYMNGIYFGPLYNLNEVDGADIDYLIWEKYGWNGSSWELDNINSKTTHGSFEEISTDVDIRFVDGVSGTSFISNEFFTTYISPGVVKDNATILDFSYYSPILRPSHKVENDFTPSTVPASGGYDLTGRELNFYIPENYKNRNYTSTPSNQPHRRMCLNGNYGKMSSNSSTSSDNRFTTKTEFIFEGDFQVSTTPGMFDIDSSTAYFFRIGLGDTTKPDPAGNTTAIFTGPYFTIREDEITFFESGGSQIGSPVTLNEKDKISIERSSGIVNFKINDSTVETSAVSYTDDCRITLYENSEYMFLGNSVVDSGTDPRTLVEIGSSGNTSGIYNDKFTMIEQYSDPRTTKIMLDTISAGLEAYDIFVEPGPGEVTLLSKSGMLWLNAADNGDTISGEAIALEIDYYEP